MPAAPGENLLTTLFADVHYYFNDPSSKPVHHRLSRGSYAYVFNNPNEHRAKLEVANHAGTPDQDAFHGDLSAVRSLQYSYKQPTLITLTLDASLISSREEWHLSTYDERNEQRYIYRIHTIDLYLWTEKDAATFLKHIQSVLPAERLDLRDAPASTQPNLAEHRDSMSPVVQQLEKTAIGAHFHPRAESTTSAQSFPGPPTPATSGGVAISPPSQQQQTQQITPLAYNPAAPSAPEPIAHREKTPPPAEDAQGGQNSNGYGNTQYASVPQGFHQSMQNTPQQSYFPGPPAPQQRQSSLSSFPGPSGGSPLSGMQNGHAGSLLPPPPPPAQTGHSPAPYTPSFGPPPLTQSVQPSSPPPSQTSFQRQSSYGHPVQQYASFGPQSPGFPNQQQPPTPSAPPSYNTHTPLQSPGLPPPPASSQYQAAQIAGYSNYSYSQAQQAQPGAYTPHAGYGGDVHNQLYRPTEAENNAQVADKNKRPQAQQEQRHDSFSGKYKVNERVDKVEKGVGRFLKKLDSKW